MTSDQNEVVQVSVEKAKIGPITARYRGGEFRDVEQPTPDQRYYAVCGLDNSHNGDYKVAYASDPLLVFSAHPSDDREELRRAIAAATETGSFPEGLREIEIPDGLDGWLPGFASTPSDAHLIDLWKQRLDAITGDGPDFMPRENAVLAYVDLSDVDG